MKCLASFLNWVFNGQSFQYVLLYTFKIMLPMSHRSYVCLASSSRVTIYKPAFYLTTMWLLTVSPLELFSVQIPTTMSDLQCLNIWLVEVMLSSKDDHVFIRVLSDLTLQIILDTLWASMTVGSKHPIACNISRHKPSWRFYLHCGIMETGSTGIICIVCHQVLHHPSDQGTSSIGKHLLAKVHIARLNEFTESEGLKLTRTSVDHAAFSELTRQGSRVISNVRLQQKFIFDS